jgi:DNA-directed RNA polymerase subunit RPC12/RpoP
MTQLIKAQATKKNSFNFAPKAHHNCVDCSQKLSETEERACRGQRCTECTRKHIERYFN